MTRAKLHCAVWLVFALGCREAATPTQTVVLIDATRAAQTAIDRLQVKLWAREAGGTYTRVASPRTVDSPNWPVKLVLAPRDGDANRRFRMDIVAQDEAAVPIANVSLETGYVRNEARFVRVRLSRCGAAAERVPLDAADFARSESSARVVDLCDPEPLPDAGSMQDADPSPPRDDDASTTPPPDDAGTDSASEPPPPPGGATCMPPCAANLVCVQRGAAAPQCEPDSACASYGCEEACVLDGDRPRCSCPAGARLRSDNKTCRRPQWLAPDPVASMLPGMRDELPFDLVRASLGLEGEALIAWYRVVDAAYVRYASRLQRGVGWTAASASMPAAISSNYRPSFALDAEGNAYATWTRMMPEPRRTMLSAYQTGYGWSMPAAISTGTDPASGPAVVANAAGDALVVWTQNHQGAPAFWTSRVRVEEPATTPARIEAISNAAFVAALAMNEAGRTLLVWDPEPTGTTTPVFASLHDPSGAWSPAQAFESRNLENPATGWQSEYRGDVAAVISELPVSMIDTDLRASVYREPGGWTEPKSLPTTNTQGIQADIAVAGDGSVVAVWNEDRIVSRDIVAARHDGRGWSMSKKIGEGELPHVAAWPDGSAIAVWVVASRKELWFSRYLPETDGWSDAERFQTGIEPASELDLVAGAQDRALVAFMGTDGASDTLWAVAFE